MPGPSFAALTAQDQKWVVRVANLKVSSNPSVVLSTYSLGSCLAITIFDPFTRVGGLLHAMLPDSTIDPITAAEQPAMFIDTGIPALFRAAYELKADKYRVQICVAGGSQLIDGSGLFSVGKRNYDSLIKLFSQHGLVVRAEHVGGVASRAVHLDLRTGEVKVTISGKNSEVKLWKG